MIDPNVYDGGWVTVCNAFDMYLPNDWVERKDMEDVENGIGLVMTDKVLQRAIVVSYIDPETISSFNYTHLDEIGEQLIDAGYEDFSRFMINGIYAIGVYDYEESSFLLMFPDVDGGVYQLTFTRIDDEEYQDYIVNMLVSVSEIGE